MHAATHDLSAGHPQGPTVRGQATASSPRPRPYSCESCSGQVCEIMSMLWTCVLGVQISAAALAALHDGLPREHARKARVSTCVAAEGLFAQRG